MSGVLGSLGCALVIALLLIAVDRHRDRRARRRQLARKAPLRTWLGR
jgi:hypothetical protein